MPTRTLVSSILKRKKNPRDFQFSFGALKSNNSKGNFVVANYSAITPIENEALLALVEQAYLTHCDSSSDVDDEETIDINQEEATPF